MNEAQAPVDGALYAARQKIYPRDIKGRFQRLRGILARPEGRVRHAAAGYPR